MTFLHPKFVDLSHWINPSVTIAALTLSHEDWLKLLAFLFVTVPLGVVQWWSLVDRVKERRAKKNAAG